MRNQMLSQLFCIFLLFSSYSCKEIFEETDKETQTYPQETLDQKSNLNPEYTGKYGMKISQSQIIVNFPETITPKMKKEIREKYFVADSVKCSCADDNTELWTLDTTKINVETAKSNLESNEGEGGVEGDYQFTFSIIANRDENSEPLLIEPISDIQAFLTNSTDDIRKANIAIIDTGMDFNQFHAGQIIPFLYRTDEIFSCENAESGWNFSDGNPDISEVLADGHGTLVTKTIISEMDSNQIPYRILPIKAFNSDGEGSYWHILCAMNYVKKLQDAVKGSNKNIDIVNASFGFNFQGFQEETRNALIKDQKNGRLKQLIDDLNKQDVLVIGSSGNDNLDNDLKENTHFPSGFDLENIFSIGGYKYNANFEFQEIAGNFGNISVDVAAPYAHDYIISRLTQIGVHKEGTSLSAAYVTAQMAEIIFENTGNTPLKPSALIEIFVESDRVEGKSGLNNHYSSGKFVLKD